MSCRIEIAASVSLSREKLAKVPGRKLMAHIPIPATCDQQSDIKILEYTSPVNPAGLAVDIAPENAPQRAISWIVPVSAVQDTGTLTFRVRYSYLYTARYRDTSKTGPFVLANSAIQDSKFYEFLNEEAPHITFTPYIRALAHELTADLPAQSNDGSIDLYLEKARRFYDFITLNMRYTFMPDYFVLDHIPENCARSFTGDCGVFALLFITLCRCAGVPAAWQSGLTAEPDYCGSHDWTRFYTPSHGWIFADPSYGVSAVRSGNEERRRFYFGNLDAWRMVANRKFYAPFTINEHAWRADPYDNQTGEVEFYSVKDDGTIQATGLRSGEYDISREILSHQELLPVPAAYR